MSVCELASWTTKTSAPTVSRTHLWTATSFVSTDDRSVVTTCEMSCSDLRFMTSVISL